MKEKIEMLVRKVVMDYLKKEKDPTMNKQLLIILDDQPSIQTNEVWNKIRPIVQNYNTTIFLSSKWSKIPEDIKCVRCIPLLEENHDEMMIEMQNADVLLYATANQSTLAKLSLTIDDCLSMWITIQMQMDGKQILLVDDYLKQKGSQKITIPFTVSKRIQNYIRQLRDDRVQIVSFSNVIKTLDSYFDSFIRSRHVVLAKHIEETVNQGEKVLVVPRNSLITPMCKDYARELGVLIKQKE